MITKDFILSKLQPYTGANTVLVDDQNTDDIIKGLLENHEKYKSEYDKISEYFVGKNDIETAKNVYNFLKKNVPYYIEPTKYQTLRSPSAILSIKPGADCKSYASFVNGIFDSLNRKGIFKIPLAYRFASYKNTKKPSHVFAVLYPEYEREIWVDNVLGSFNEKREPSFYKDKKIKMALVSMSGTDDKQSSVDQLKAYRDKLVNIQQTMLNNGQIIPGSSNDLQMKVAINNVTKQIQNYNMSMSGTIGEGENTVGFDWGNFFNNVITAGGEYFKSQQPNNQFYGQQNQIPFNQQQYPSGQVTNPYQGSGMNNSTLYIIGGGALLLYFILKKK